MIKSVIHFLCFILLFLQFNTSFASIAQALFSRWIKEHKEQDSQVFEELAS